MYGLYDYFMSCIPDRSNKVSLQKRISTSKGIGTKGIATKGIATKGIGYKKDRISWEERPHVLLFKINLKIGGL